MTCPTQHIGLYILPFAFGNFLGPLLLGRFFDTIGRKPMIAVTYGLAGLLLALTGYLFWQGLSLPSRITLAWSSIFFFASAGASAAYLTVSEMFPMEIRAMAIAFFFIVAQGAGVIAPWLFGLLIETSATSVAYGYLIGAGLMLIGALVALVFGVKAERQSLEDIATPLSAQPRFALPEVGRTHDMGTRNAVTGPEPGWSHSHGCACAVDTISLLFRQQAEGVMVGRHLHLDECMQR